MKILLRLSISICSLSVCLAVAVQAQSRPAPSLTDDDLAPVAVSKPANVSPAAADGKAKADGKGAEEKKAEGKAENPAETAWNERLRQAQAKVKDLERRADQAELQITQVRNNQNDATRARSTDEINQANNRQSELGQQSRQLREEAAVAQAEVNALLAEGQANGYHVIKADETTRNAEAQEDQSDAQARIQVIQLRITRIRSEMLRTSDNYARNRLRAELQEEEENLNQARNKAQAGRKQKEVTNSQENN